MLESAPKSILTQIATAPYKMPSINELFKGHHFDREIILICVRSYPRFKPNSLWWSNTVADDDDGRLRFRPCVRVSVEERAH
jgi:hypothetical protein